MFAAVGLAARIQMQGDDPVILAPRRNIERVSVAESQMARALEAIGNDAGVKARGQDKAVRLVSQCGQRNTNTKAGANGRRGENPDHPIPLDCCFLGSLIGTAGQCKSPSPRLQDAFLVTYEIAATHRMAKIRPTMGAPISHHPGVAGKTPEALGLTCRCEGRTPYATKHGSWGSLDGKFALGIRHGEIRRADEKVHPIEPMEIRPVQTHGFWRGPQQTR